MPVELLDHQLKEYYTVAVDVAKKAGEVTHMFINMTSQPPYRLGQSYRMHLSRQQRLTGPTMFLSGTLLSFGDVEKCVRPTVRTLTHLSNEAPKHFLSER